VPLEFTATAAEFFRIWIVNLCLTILSLGIYSAWAKVRTRRYFYSNTWLDGAAFEYTADPKRILMGRLIVLVLALGYSFAGQFNQWVGLAFALLIFVATPWLVVRSLAFHRRNSRLRNVRFVFRGAYREAAAVFIGWPIVAALTLGLLFPWVHGRQQQFVVRNTSYGVTPFDFEWESRGYYWLYLKAFGVSVAIAVAAFFALSIVGMPSVGDDEKLLLPDGFLPVAISAYLVFLAGVNAVIRAGSTNLFFENSTLGPHGFFARLRGFELFGLYAASALAIVFSVGLATPWVMVRLARYRLERIRVVATGELDAFLQAAEQAHPLGEVAEEAAGALDFGFDFGL
jgi:uncharacterized membrane protein YjgN (DUF898 family)